MIACIDATGSRYRGVMENMNAFLRTHAVPASLQRRVRQHVESTFSENKGIDVQSIANQLPSHLQVEVFYHLNLAMLRRVDVLRCCHQPFLKHLVTRLQFSLVSCGQYASRVRQPLLGISFVRRGILQVFDGPVVRHPRPHTRPHSPSTHRAPAVTPAVNPAVTPAVSPALTPRPQPPPSPPPSHTHGRPRRHRCARRSRTATTSARPPWWARCSGRSRSPHAPTSWP